MARFPITPFSLKLGARMRFPSRIFNNLMSIKKKDIRKFRRHVIRLSRMDWNTSGSIYAASIKEAALNCPRL